MAERTPKPPGIAVVLLTLILLASLSCTPPPTRRTTPTQRSHPSPTSAATPPATPRPAAPFALGIEYGSPGLAALYAPLAIEWVKPWPAQARWGDVEPKPGQFEWKKVDRTVQEYQKAGFRRMNLCLTGAGSSCTPADPACFDRYAEYARRVVERYDGDGQDDMPGLRDPIHLYCLEAEFTGYWPYSAEDYIHLAQAVYPVIHRADPQAQVMLVAILVGDVFDGNPPAEEVTRRLNTPQPHIRKSVAEIRTLLDHPELFDVVDFHSLADYSEIPPTVAWLRAEMAQRGYDKPIWIGDAFSMSPLMGFGLETCETGQGRARTFYPATEETRCQAAELIQAYREKNHPKHGEAVAWVRAEAARGLVKKVVVAAGEGLAGINIGNMDDWNLPLTGLAAYQGMADVFLAMGSRKPRPAYHSLGMLVQSIRGFSAIERLAGLPEGVWAYRFTVRDHPVLVAWYDPGGIPWLGEPEPSLDVALPWAQASAQVTPIVTQEGQSSPQGQAALAEGGHLGLRLGRTPVFVETAP